MAPSEPGQEAVDVVLDGLMDLGLEPRLVDHGRIDELRGGLRCFDLKAGYGVDAAVLLSRGEVVMFPPGVTEKLYKVEYAVRGTVRGVLPGRILSRTTKELRGLIRKKLVGLNWEVPSGPHGGAKGRLASREGGIPPGPGEIWEGGPHQALAERLNRDKELMGALESLKMGEEENPPIISVYSDGWGESIRIRGEPWLDLSDIPLSYAAPIYLEIVSGIGGHVKEVRRSFGGLTF